MKILVADDSKTFRGLINASLVNLGHEVMLANNGDDAIKFYKEHHPDLVILDVTMEGMNGFECARLIRKINPEDWIPIIFLSATVDDESIAKGIEAGGDDYLTKPYSEITLQAKIKAMQRIAVMRKQLYKTMQELKKLTSIDTLTGLYNRFQFEISIREKIAFCKRHSYSIAVLFIDLDHFKLINDTLGHEYGDLLLQEVAKRIKANTREDDFVARLGGDEFVVIVTGEAAVKDVGELAQKLVDRLSYEYIIRDNHLKIGASIGIATYPSENVTEETLIRCADVAMYTAKKLGRNNYQYYTEQLNEEYKKQHAIEHELRFAMDRNEMEVLYQPIYDLQTRQINEIEALMRWNHPDLGVIMPEEFIQVAEEIGLISELGLWVIKESCKQMSSVIAKKEIEIKLAVNVSVRQFMNSNFIDEIVQVAKETSFPLNKLIIEFNETNVIAYSSIFKEAITRINDCGVEVTIDNFGVKHTSLQSFKDLPISKFKIDKNFIRNIHKDVKNAIIVKSLISLGESLGIDVIAEGIQQKEELDFLIQNGCMYGQGYLLSKPNNKEGINKKIEENKLMKKDEYAKR